MKSRLQKVMAQAGLCSRREAETWISSGRVTINGRPAVLGQVADTDVDKIAIDGRPLQMRLQRVYLILNKPRGYTTSLKDRHAEHLISELIPSKFGRVFPVGRLDKETSGLMVLTNDGLLAHHLMHPSYAVPKVYEAWVEGVPRRAHLARLTRGIQLDDGYSHPRDVRVIRTESNRTLFSLTLTEGRKREVRRIFESIGHPVISLKRVAFGSLTLGGLGEGDIRPLTHREVKELYTLVEQPQRKNSKNRRDDRSSEYTQSRFTARGVKYPGRAAISTRQSGHTVGNTRRNSGRDYR
ncbi:MAG: rRNA pseudouridine synthase [Firmicutes bacterium]|uniref:Pseudouridine synthase n=1 Tax=Sulfobacillus benefaciens TaxID=453960 RepID=A0A2T2XB61_9FIRM|nr:rRNA pseudouridine synthase [Bacillota bacterium]MCL5015776.1 rRNA pseudouridine synthase [Bacillota bacterium]PSR31763.1 MAG: rRNA pseudouridine synthase [Sulfobacillus benefaciens]